jgi:glycosyltransferase involved in cell wall biosynthesis
VRILNIAFAFATVSHGAVGGAEQILGHIDRALSASGHDSLVVAASDSQICGTLFGTPAAPEHVNKDYYRFRYTEHKRAIAEALSSGPVDLVHMHGFDFYEFIPDSDVPVLATLHLPPAWYKDWIFHVQRLHFHLNCVSNSQRQAIPHAKLLAATIPNGVNIPRLVHLPIHERSGAVMLGRICPEKGIHTGIAAARRAGIPITIAGRVFGYSEHREYFEKQVRPTLNDRTRFVGSIGLREKTELLRRAKCLLVASSVPETSSLVSMEALACGTPVIAMNAGALPEIVEHGKTGFIVSSEDEMAEAIRHVEEIDPAVCRQTAVERFSADRMCRQYISLYERLIGLHEASTFPGVSVADPRASRVA